MKNLILNVLIVFFLILTKSSSAQEDLVEPFCVDDGPRPSCTDSTFKLEFVSSGTNVIDIEHFVEGETIELLVLLDVVEERGVFSWSFGLRHDPEVLKIVEIDTDDPEGADHFNKCIWLQATENPE